MSRCLRCGADASWIQGDPPKMSRDDEVTALRAEIARLQGQTHFDPNAELQARLDEALRERDEARAEIVDAVNVHLPALVQTVKDELDALVAIHKEKLSEARALLDAVKPVVRAAIAFTDHPDQPMGNKVDAEVVSLPASVREWASEQEAK